MTSSTRHNTVGFDYRPEGWMADALCAGYPAHWWDLEPTTDIRTRQTARAICAACPVRAMCAEYAMTTEAGFDRWGLWGGLDPEQRRELDKATA